MAPAHLLSLKDLSCTFFGKRELQESGSTECSIHTVPMTRLCTQLTLIWEATSYGNFSLLFHKKMTMRKEVQCSRNLEHYHYYAKKKKKIAADCFPLSDLMCSQMENLWFLWLLATRNHMRWVREKDTKLYLYLVLNFSEIP